MKELLLMSIISLPLFLLVLMVIFSLKSAKYKLGKYTKAYRCEKCGFVYVYEHYVCEECGHKSYWAMNEEVGKWKSCITKSGIVYKWEPKEKIVTNKWDEMERERIKQENSFPKGFKK